jgi:hypothetical protein
MRCLSAGNNHERPFNAELRAELQQIRRMDRNKKPRKILSVSPLIQRGTTMKRVLLALSAVAALMVSAGAASAQDIHVGPGGVDVGPRHHYYDTGNCRTIIDHHVGPNGNSVTVRRRVCD